MSSSATRNGPYLSPSSLPSALNITFPHSSFFSNCQNSLPTPAEVRLFASLRDPQPLKPDLVRFPSMSLIVKCGFRITIAEAQCRWAICQSCPNVPVPEVYGWCQDEGETFIYMQLIEGNTLAEEWPNMEIEEKYDVCNQLRHIIDELRQLQQEPSNPFIRSINQTCIKDVIFDHHPPDITFTDVASFHDWFSCLAKGKVNRSDLDPWRPGLLDDVPIVFTHSDLHGSNIMMTWEKGGKPRISAIIDWYQSGWYPASWEFYKMRWTSLLGEQWELDFMLEILQAYRGFICWDAFLMMRGC